jgi:carbonic anhydrase
MASDDTQGQIATLVAAIQPAVKLAKAEPGEALDQAVRINVAMVVRRLRTSAPILAPLVEEGSIMILGAHYDLSSGVVELLL